MPYLVKYGKTKPIYLSASFSGLSKTVNSFRKQFDMHFNSETKFIDDFFSILNMQSSIIAFSYRLTIQLVIHVIV